MAGNEMSRKSGMIDFFRKVGDAVLGIGRIPSKVRRRTKPRKKPRPKRGEEVPKALRDFFERRHAGWPEYVMLKAQLAILALFAISVIHIVILPAETVLCVPILTGLSVYLIYLATTQLKRAFRRDYPAYRWFTAMCVSIAWVFVVALRYSPVEFSLQNLYLAIVPPAVAIGFVFVAFMTFRFRYGRNFTYGKVEGVHGRKATVRVGYDICSNVKAGIYTVESLVKVRRGDTVKLSVERPLLGLRGAKVGAILGKAK